MDEHFNLFMFIHLFIHIMLLAPLSRFNPNIRG